MKIWIDVTNSPHVLFFNPIIAELKKRNHKVIVTARDFAQTIELLDNYKIPYKRFGKHYGKNMLFKILGLISRSIRLTWFAFGKRFDLALSHNSNDIAVASFLLRIPLVTMFDYEYAASHHINIRCAKKVLVPEVIKLNKLRKYGCTKKKLDHYPGLKEQIYLYDFIPDASIVKSLHLDKKKIIVTIRPPATMSHYHNVENKLFSSLLRKLSSDKKVQMVILPRTNEQKEQILNMKLNNIVISKKAVDAPSLIYFSDLVISAGGTMNREAVALNTPVYTIFAPKTGAVDLNLMKSGKLKKLANINQIRLVKKKAHGVIKINGPRMIVNKILETLI